MAHLGEGNSIYRFIRSRGLWITVVVVIALFYFLVDPLQSRWVPQCVFHKITGLQCMGCGSQRMAHALLHGNFQEAFRANSFVLMLLPFLVLFTFVELKRTKYPRLYSTFHSQWVIITVSAMLLAWLILRNILHI